MRRKIKKARSLRTEPFSLLCEILLDGDGAHRSGRTATDADHVTADRERGERELPAHLVYGEKLVAQGVENLDGCRLRCGNVESLASERNV